MKQTIRWVLVSAVTCAIGSLVTYRIAYHRGYEDAYKNGTLDQIARGNFSQSIAFFAALQKLRSEDVLGATRLLEKICFSSAHIFYKEPMSSAEQVSDWGRRQGLDQSPGAEVPKEFARDLMKYRTAYRTNAADWDDMERKLDMELTKVK